MIIYCTAASTDNELNGDASSFFFFFLSNCESMWRAAEDQLTFPSEMASERKGKKNTLIFLQTCVFALLMSKVSSKSDDRGYIGKNTQVFSLKTKRMG